jgi:8-oxo-dGTP pyrophosphatase MutT (NUDIX family)
MPDDFRSRLKSALSERQPRRHVVDDARAAAVLVPIVASPEPTLLFTLRTETVRSHKGQISFPGGSIDDTDPSPEAAALREAEEEVGLEPDFVEVLGELDTFPTFVTGYVVTPFVGWIAEPPLVRPNPAEVAEVLMVPLADLTDAIRSEPGFSHGGRTFPTEAWVWNDRVIWGVTARLLRTFLTIVSDAGLTAPPGTTRSWGSWPDDAVAASRGA